MSYRQQLRSVVTASAAPYGYTLTVWTSGAAASHAQGALPAPVQAALLLVGAVLGFGTVGAFAFGGINQEMTTRAVGPVRVWGGMHLLPVGTSIGVVTGLTLFVHGDLMWALAGFAATVIYLSTVSAQFWLATRGPSR